MAGRLHRRQPRVSDKPCTLARCPLADVLLRHGYYTGYGGENGRGGSQYAIAFRDAKGNPFDGGKTYKLHLPPNIPVKNFWSLVIYDNQTRSMLQTDAQFPSIGSQKEGIEINPDTSVDVYFGPKPPRDKENNWVQTVPDKGWNVILRLYGPLEPWSDKTWQPGEIELVK